MTETEKGHDPKLVAALRSLVKRLEATPEELRGSFLVKGLKPYLPATPTETEKPAPDGLEVVAWRGVKGDGSRNYTEIKRVAEIWADQNITVIPFVRASQAEKWKARAETAEAEVKRLTEANSALMAERKILIETKREQIKRLTEDNEALREAIIGLNVTDEELVRIHNSCTGVDGEVQIWAKMLHMLVANIIAVRAVLSGSKEK